MDNIIPFHQYRRLRKSHVRGSTRPNGGFYRICIATSDGPIIIALQNFDKFVDEHGKLIIDDFTQPVSAVNGGAVFVSPAFDTLDNARVILLTPKTMVEVWKMDGEEFEKFVQDNRGRVLTKDEKVSVIFALSQYYREDNEYGLHPTHPWWNIVHQHNTKIEELKAR